jgi:hypothetical protein
MKKIDVNANRSDTRKYVPDAGTAVRNRMK